MKGTEFVSDEEAAAFEAQILEACNKDRRADLPAFLDIEYAYNDFWWDYGSNITDDRRTSLIVDPPNGRIPPLTPAARSAPDSSANATAEADGRSATAMRKML